jgi:hypothetical protein
VRKKEIIFAILAENLIILNVLSFQNFSKERNVKTSKLTEKNIRNLPLFKQIIEKGRFPPSRE